MDNLLEIKNLYVEYKTTKINESKIVKAVNGVSLSVRQGETYAIAGESGCGKSTLAKTVMKLVPVKSGEILYMGKNISDYTKQELKDYRKSVQMVFQNPYSSLNPKMKIKHILCEPLEINTDLSKEEIFDKVEKITEKVGLDKSSLELYPHEFSGGQRQRIAIARALILEPKMIIADEPVSALDASIQAQILNMLNDLKREFNLTMVFISHDLSVIKFLADRVGIMYLGELMEEGTTEEIFNTPSHPYTKVLLNSVPRFDKKTEEFLQGDIPVELPSGCKFSSRCKYSADACDLKCPEFTLLSDTHKVRCTL